MNRKYIEIFSAYIHPSLSSAFIVFYSHFCLSPSISFPLLSLLLIEVCKTVIVSWPIAVAITGEKWWWERGGTGQVIFVPGWGQDSEGCWVGKQKQDFQDPGQWSYSEEQEEQVASAMACSTFHSFTVSPGGSRLKPHILRAPTDHCSSWQGLRLPWYSPWKLFRTFFIFRGVGSSLAKVNHHRSGSHVQNLLVTGLLEMS